MKVGRTIQSLAAEIDRQREAKKDYLAPTRGLHTRVADGRINLLMGGGDDANPVKILGIGDLGHDQLGDWAKIPKAYYDRMKVDAPELLTRNINQWLQASNDKRMLRTLDDQLRAFLSDRYRCLDNADIAEAVLPTVMEQKLEIVSCEITEKRLYIKVCDPRIQQDIDKRAMGQNRYMGDGSHVIFDTVCPAMVVTNSEVGLGKFSVEVGTWTKACTNLAVFASRGMRKFHLGGRVDLGEDIWRLLGDDTRKATDKAVWMQVRDTVKNAFNEEKFRAMCETIQETADNRITGDVVKVIEVTAKRFGLSDDTRGSVLKHLISGGDLSQYGLSNAVTRAAEDQDDYDKASEMELIGGQIIDMTPRDWYALAEAA